MAKFVEMASKVGCFTGFCHHYLETTSVLSMHVAILCLEVEWNQVCEQPLYVEYIVVLRKHKELQ